MSLIRIAGAWGVWCHKCKSAIPDDIVILEPPTGWRTWRATCPKCGVQNVTWLPMERVCPQSLKPSPRSGAPLGTLAGTKLHERACGCAARGRHRLGCAGPPGRSRS